MFRDKIASFRENRASNGPLPAGSTPYTCSRLFKSEQGRNQTTARLWTHRLSRESQAKTKSTLKTNSIISRNTISLGTGRPAPSYFPWKSMAIQGIDVSQTDRKSSTNQYVSMCCEKEEDGYDLGVALGYGYAAGSPQVLRFVTEHVELVHDPSYDDWESCLTCGTTSAIEILFRMFCERSDWIITEAQTYPGTIEAAKALGLNCLGVSMDDFGLSPEDLGSKLRNWDSTRGKKPFLLYTIPCGQNPTGCTQTPDRRRAIYQIAEEHDLIIVEDDPYYFLQMGDMEFQSQAQYPLRSVEKYFGNLPISYLSLDTSGRVIRLDTTSKILAPGLRCGWLTASSQVVEKFLSYTEVSTVSPSGPSQVMLYKLLDETWGHEGFLGWLNNLSLQYRRSRDVLIQACQQYLPMHICRWSVPTAGMFLWISIDCSNYPSTIVNGIENEAVSHLGIEDRIFIRAKQNGVLVSKGSWFEVEQEYSCHVNFRMTFAAASTDALVQAVMRFGDALGAEFLLDR